MFIAELASFPRHSRAPSQDQVVRVAIGSDQRKLGSTDLPKNRSYNIISEESLCFTVEFSCHHLTSRTCRIHQLGSCACPTALGIWSWKGQRSWGWPFRCHPLNRPTEFWGHTCTATYFHFCSISSTRSSKCVSPLTKLQKPIGQKAFSSPLLVHLQSALVWQLITETTQYS